MNTTPSNQSNRNEPPREKMPEMNINDLLEIEKQEAKEIAEINLKVLQKLDSDIESILYCTSFCSLHELDRASKVWHACETAGPLFIVRRTNLQSLKIILLNQKSPIDYEEEVYPGQKFELKESEKFLFFQNKNHVIKGLWISNIEDLKKIHAIIKTCTN